MEHLANIDRDLNIINNFTRRSMELNGRTKAIAYVITTRKYDTMVLGFNPKYMGMAEKELSDMVVRNQKANFFMPTDADKTHLYVVTHEYGHMVHNDWIRRQNIVTDSIGGLYDSVDDEVKKLLKEQAEAEGISISDVKSKYISKYGQTNEHETFAELFAHVVLSENPNALGTRFIDWLRRNGYDGDTLFYDK